MFFQILPTNLSTILLTPIFFYKHVYIFMTRAQRRRYRIASNVHAFLMRKIGNWDNGKFDVIKRRKLCTYQCLHRTGVGVVGGGRNTPGNYKCLKFWDLIPYLRVTNVSHMPWTCLIIQTEFLLEFQSKVSKVLSLFQSVLTNSQGGVIFVGLIPRVSPPHPLWGKH